VCVDAPVSGAFGRADLVDDVEVAAHPAARVLAPQPVEVQLDLDSGELSRIDESPRS
jgi:hypothetical protein